MLFLGEEMRQKASFNDKAARLWYTVVAQPVVHLRFAT